MVNEPILYGKPFQRLYYFMLKNKENTGFYFGKNVYWHIIVANVISFHTVAGIAHYITLESLAEETENL